MVITAIGITVVFGMVAFAIDIGYIVHVRTELQRTADACALAAARCLPDTSDATAMAHTVAAENGWVSGVQIGEGDEMHGSDVDPLDVEFGRWDRDSATFTTPAPSGRSTNAVRVILRRTEGSKNPLGLFFARILGVGESDVSASATAWYDRGVCGPFVGVEWLDVGGGAITDSFDSFEGPYDPASANDRGSICSDGPIDVGGTSTVRGDALAGMHEPLPDVHGTGVVTGHSGNRITPLDLPPVDASEAAVNNDNDAAQAAALEQVGRRVINGSNFMLNAGETFDLPAGTYCFRDVKLVGGATLNISGATTIYVTGTFMREGGCVVNNNTQLARNLQILSTGGTMVVNSVNDFYGVIYAPQSDVTLNGDADLYGAIVGGTLKVNGSGWAHYDETLDMEHLEVPPRTMLVD